MTEVSYLHEEDLKIMYQTVHQSDNFDIFEFSNRFLYIPAVNMDNTSKKILNVLSKDKVEILKRKKDLNILLIGPGDGRLELKLLESIVNEFKIDIKSLVAVDINNNSINNLAENISRNKTLMKKIKVDENLFLINSKFESFNPICKFDLILAFFVLNFTNDWIKAVERVFEISDKNTLLLVSEDIYDILFIDNFFDSIERFFFDEDNIRSDRVKFFKFWKYYFFQRYVYGYSWNPIVSPARMGKIYEKLDKEFCSIGEIDEEWQNSKTSWSDWLEIIRGEKEIFNCLYVIPKSLKERLYGDCNSFLKENLKVKKLNMILKLKYGHKIVIYSKKDSI